MTTIATTLDRRLAQAAQLTGTWKQHVSRRPSPLKGAVTAVASATDFMTRGVFWAWRNRRYLTVRKLTNMAVVNVEFMLKRERLIGRPYNLKIEPTNICNTRCQLCPTGQGLKGRRKGRMDFDRYTALLDQVRWHVFGLDLSMWGDPLVHQDIHAMIRHAHDRGIWTYISSNLHAFRIEPRKTKDGSVEDTDDATKLIASGLDMLTCSLHAASQETFAIYQPGKSFGDAMAKVRHIVETKQRLGSTTPAIQLNFVVTRHNEHEIETFEALATELGCKPVISTASMNIRFLDRDKRLRDLDLDDATLKEKVRRHLADWLPSKTEHVLPAYTEILKTGDASGDQYNGEKTFNCSWPWRQAVINWDGQTVTCCGSFEPEHDMGDVFDQPFKNVWNGEKYRLSRRSFKRRLTEAQSENNACAECPGFML